jgi:hypothetical protein
VTIEILDGGQHVIRRLSSIPQPKDDDPESEEDDEARLKRALQTDPGVQRAVWDLAREGAKRIAKARIESGDPERGPMVPPGTYTARVSADGRTITTPLRIVRDPRVTVLDAELQAQEAFALRVREDLALLESLVTQLRTMRDQISARRTLLEGRPQTAELLASGDRIVARADEIERALHNPTAEVTFDILAQRGGAKLYSRMSALLAYADEGDGAPTQGLQDQFAACHAELTKLAGDVQSLVVNDVASLNQAASRAGIGYVVTK